MSVRVCARMHAHCVRACVCVCVPEMSGSDVNIASNFFFKQTSSMEFSGAIKFIKHSATPI